MVRPPTLPLRLRQRQRQRAHTLLPPAARLLHATAPARAGGSALFNLGGLAASREGQYLSRERGIPRTEFSSSAQLIRSSEVDPFAPAPGAATHASADALRTRLDQEREGPRRFPQGGALAAGRRAAQGGLAAEVERLRAAVGRLQERDEAHKAAVLWLLSTLASLLAGTTAALWYSSAFDAGAAPAPAAAVHEAQAQAQGGVADVDGAAGVGTGMALEPPAPPAEETAIEAARRDQHARGFLESLFWSSRQGR